MKFAIFAAGTVAAASLSVAGAAEAAPAKPTKSLTKTAFGYARAFESGDADKIEKYLMDTKKCIRQAQRNADGVEGAQDLGLAVDATVKKVKKNGSKGTVKIVVEISDPEDLYDGEYDDKTTTTTKWRVVGKKWLKTCE